LLESEVKKATKKLEKEIAEITRRALGEDTAEDIEFGDDFRGDEMPEELGRHETRIAAIRAAKERLGHRAREQEQSEPKHKAQENCTAGLPAML